MDKDVKKEVFVFLPLFAVIVVLTMYLDYLKPAMVPVIGIDGTAAQMVAKSSLPYHIPVVELAIFVVATFLQFYYKKINVLFADFIFKFKLSLIIFTGLVIPGVVYLYTIKFLTNIWYLLAPAVSLFVFYFFFIMLMSGLLDLKTKKATHTATIASFKKKKKKK